MPKLLCLHARPPVFNLSPAKTSDTTTLLTPPLIEKNTLISMMKFLALSMFFSILALHVVSATFLTGWSSCGEETDWFNLSEMDLEPPPPILSGKNITVVLGGHLSTPIVDG